MITAATRPATTSSTAGYRQVTSPAPDVPPTQQAYAYVIAYDSPPSPDSSTCATGVSWSYRLVGAGQGGPGLTSASSPPAPARPVAVIGGPGYTCDYTNSQSGLEGGLWQISNSLGHSCQVSLPASTTASYTNVAFTSPTTCSS